LRAELRPDISGRFLIRRLRLERKDPERSHLPNIQRIARLLPRNG
jgi:hypothetical protein